MVLANPKIKDSIARLTARHGNSARLKHVDMVALTDGKGLVRGQSRVRKHANLKTVSVGNRIIVSSKLT